MRQAASLFLSLSLAFAQQPAAQPPKPAAANSSQPNNQPVYQSSGGTATFSATAQLVVEQVFVKDKDGKPIEGLTKNDFTVTEENAPQTISFLEFQKLDDAPKAPLPEMKTAVAPRARLGQEQITPEKPGDIKYKDRRLLAIYFDLNAMQLPDQIRALDAAQKFIRTKLTPSDLVSVMKYSNGVVQVIDDFTDDRERLISTIQTIAIGEDEDSPQDPSDKGAAFGQDDSEFNIFNTDRQLAALQTAVTMLGQLNEKKAMVYFASGLRLQGSNNQAQLRATENAAVRAGVSIFAADARGLVATPPLGDATRGSMGGQQMYSGAGVSQLATAFAHSQDTLYTLSADTGGKALLDFNDLEVGLVNAQKAFSSYYILGYYTTNDKLDGKFRRVKVTLNGGLQANVSYREGYYAGKVFGKFNATEKERQLEEALMLPDPVTELTLALEVNYFQLNRADYFIPIVLKVPGSELALARKGGAETTVIDFIGEIKDEFGATMSNLRDKVPIKLTEATAQEWVRRPVVYDAGFTLLPGKYKMKVLARDNETGRMGTMEYNFVIPNLDKAERNADEKRIQISSVVLSSQKAPMNEALFNATKDKSKDAAQTAVNPLIQGGFKLLPSVTRVFSKQKEMYVYLQAYQQVDNPNPLAGFVTFYKGTEKVYQTAPIQVTEGAANRLKTMALKFTVALDKLEPGEYDVQVTVLDPTGSKATFWSTPIAVIN